MFKEILNLFINKTINYPKYTILLFVIISLMSIIYFKNNIQINTSTESLISEKLDFRKKQNELSEFYPFLKNNNIIVVSGKDYEDSIILVRNILSKFKKQDDKFNFYFCPQLDNFFKDNFFKFLDDSSKDQIIDRIYKFQPFISEMNNNPKLKGLNNLLELSIKNQSEVNYFLDILKKMNSSISEKKKINWESEFVKNQDFYIIFGLKQDYVKNNKFSDFYNFLNGLKEIRPDISVNFTGSQILDYEELQSVTDGAIDASLLSILLVGIILWIAFRNFLIIFSILASIFVGLSITVGIATIVVGSLNIISVAFAVLFIGISVDFGIQLSLRLREINIINVKNVILSIREISQSILIVGVTSIIGFLSFIPTDYIGLSELGIVSAVGVIVGLVTNILFLPSLLTTFKVIKNKKSLFLINNSLLKLINFLNKKRILMLPLFLMFLVFSIFSYNQIYFDSDPIKLKNQQSQSVILALKLLDKDPSTDYKISVFSDNWDQTKIEKVKNLTSVKSIFSIRELLKDENNYDDDVSHLRYLLKSEYNSFHSDINELKRFIIILESLSKFENNSESDLLMNLVKNLNNINLKEFREIEKLWFGDFNKMVLNIQKLLEFRSLDENSIPDFFKNRYVAKNGFERIEIYPKESVIENNGLKKFVDEIIEIFPNATGMPVIQQKASEVVILSFIHALIITLSILIIFCYLVFKNIFYLILSLLPVIVSIPITAILMYVFSINLNFANMISLPLIFSLGMSYTIFMLKRYQQNRCFDKLMMSSTPSAVMFSGLTTISSFSTLAISSHSGTSSMGLLLFISLVVTLFSCLVILPLLIKVFEKKL